jgi:hypothetical protein
MARLLVLLVALLAGCARGGASPGPQRTTQPASLRQLAAGAVASGCAPVQYRGGRLHATCAHVELTATSAGDRLAYACSVPDADVCRRRLEQLLIAGRPGPLRAAVPPEARARRPRRFTIVAVDASDRAYRSPRHWVGRMCVSDDLQESDEGAPWLAGTAVCVGVAERMQFHAIQVAYDRGEELE